MGLPNRIAFFYYCRKTLRVCEYEDRNKRERTGVLLLVSLRSPVLFPKIDGQKKKLRQPLACFDRRDPIITEPRIFHTSPKTSGPRR